MWIKDQKDRLLHLESGNMIYRHTEYTARDDRATYKVIHTDITGEHSVTIFTGRDVDCMEIMAILAQKLQAHYIAVE